MTQEQKKQIAVYRRNGMKFSEIAAALQIPETTIKSYCYRNKFSAAFESKETQTGFCPQCGLPIPPARFRPRRFCSDKCRYQYWILHSTEQKRNTQKSICPGCGKSFMDYSCHKRKYCSHECYILIRYGGICHD